MAGARAVCALGAVGAAWALSSLAAAQTISERQPGRGQGAAATTSRGHVFGSAADPRRREEPEPGDPGPVEIRPSLPMAEAAGWRFRPEPAPSGGEAQAEEALDRYFDEQLQQDRLAHVGADPWYYQLMRGMRRGFEPDMQRVEERRRAPMNPLGRLADEFGRYARGPEAPQDARGAPPPEIANSQLEPDEQAALEAADWMNLNNAPVTWHRVEVHVVQNPEGVVGAMWVTRSSGYPSLDEQALRAVREGADATPPPPPDVVGDRQAIETEWAFEAGDVATYLNQAGCVDDPVDGGLQCAALGRGIVRTRVQLLRVVDAENESFEERRREARDSPPRLRGD